MVQSDMAEDTHKPEFPPAGTTLHHIAETKTTALVLYSCPEYITMCVGEGLLMVRDVDALMGFWQVRP
jgi:hypothetical protein